MNQKMGNSDGKIILVVDDNRDAADTLSMFLNLKGYRAHACYSGKEALEAVETVRPDLVILDLAMPDMDGYETATILRASHGLSLPLVVLSGYGQPEDRRRATEAGFNAHMVKPVEFAALLELLNIMLTSPPSSRA